MVHKGDLCSFVLTRWCRRWFCMNVISYQLGGAQCDVVSLAVWNLQVVDGSEMMSNFVSLSRWHMGHPFNYTTTIDKKKPSQTFLFLPERACQLKCCPVQLFTTSVWPDTAIESDFSIWIRFQLQLPRVLTRESRNPFWNDLMPATFQCSGCSQHQMYHVCNTITVLLCWISTVYDVSMPDS